ncbi:MAG: insulinase family protein [Spirochaetaceae bacterium]|jgi:zinc protease|nr:insulinase family protein [Spirochaetaceae bacterium]
MKDYYRRKPVYFLVGLALWAALAGCETWGGGSPAEGKPLEEDSALVSGVLKNGFSYRILPNQYPENRIYLRLVVKVGSVLEAPKERGLAHFVEHMAFNGTTHFSGNELVSYFETLGIPFGPEVNAYTSFDETVYQLEIPADDPEALDTSLTVIADWAQGITFDEEELEKERGVVLEEWRQHRGLNQRAWDKLMPFLFPWSRYAERMPIGKPDIIRKAPRERLVKFYKKWYRPELMTLVITGDADPAALEQAVQERLSVIPAGVKPRARPTYPVSVSKAKLSLRLSDPEASDTQVFIGSLFPAEPLRTQEDQARYSAVRVAINALWGRLYEQVQEGELFLSCRISVNSLLRSMSLGVIEFSPKPGVFEEAFKVVMDEIDRFVQYGITETELQRLKLNMRSWVLEDWQDRKKIESSRLAYQLVQCVLDETPFLSADEEYRLSVQAIEALSADTVNAVIRRYFDKRGSRLVTIVPQDADVPGKAAIERLWKGYHAASLAPYKDDLDERPFFPQELTEHPGSIRSQRVLSDVPPGAEEPVITEFTLSNGARVLVCPTDFKEDFFVFNALSQGGLSLVSDEDYPSAWVADSYIEESGLNGFRWDQVTKKLAGTSWWIQPILQEAYAGLRGSAPARDREVFFQLVNLYFTAPYFTQAGWKRVQGNLTSRIAGNQQYPQDYFHAELLKRLYPGSVRSKEPDAAFIAALDPAKAEGLYRQFYGEAGNFTFIFTGAITVDEVKRLSEVYLASLPAGDRREAQDVLPAFPEGKQVLRIRKGIEPQGRVRILFGGVNPEIQGDLYAEQDLVGAMVELLELRLREKIREDLGASYGVEVHCHQQNYPTRRYRASINFGCEPERAEALLDLVLGELKALGVNPAREKDLIKLREGFSRKRETARKTNDFWQQTLVSNALQGDESAGYSSAEAVLAGLTEETLQRLVRRYFNTENYQAGILLPE